MHIVMSSVNTPFWHQEVYGADGPQYLVAPADNTTLAGSGDTWSHSCLLVRGDEVRGGKYITGVGRSVLVESCQLVTRTLLHKSEHGCHLCQG